MSWVSSSAVLDMGITRPDLKDTRTLSPSSVYRHWTCAPLLRQGNNNCMHNTRNNNKDKMTESGTSSQNTLWSHNPHCAQNKTLPSWKLKYLVNLIRHDFKQNNAQVTLWSDVPHCALILKCLLKSSYLLFDSAMHKVKAISVGSIPWVNNHVVLIHPFSAKP